MSEWPIYEKENITLGNLESNVGIVTLWTPRKLITSKIDPSLFAAAGQLYFDGGINFLLRNCLANKKIRYLILAGQDLAKSAEGLLALKERGVDDNYHISGLKRARIHKEIPKEAIDNFRGNVEVIDMRSKDVSEIIEKIKTLENKESYGEGEIFPGNKIDAPSKLPSDPAVHKIREKTVGRAWLDILYNIMKFGAVKKSSYGGDQKELINLCTVIEEEDPFNPKWEDYFQFTKEELEGYIPQVTTAMKIKDVTYTYGYRFRAAELKDGSRIDQIQIIIDVLKKFPYRRGAIAFSWDYDTDARSKLQPCLNLIHCLVQDDILHMTVYIRSNDMYEAWPRNAFALRRLHGFIVKEISKETPLGLGTLTIISASAHLYEKNWFDAQEVIKKYRPSYKLRFDPKGNFRIEVNDGKIKITHKDFDGNPLGVYEDTLALRLVGKLAHSHVISEIGHALDIGTELQKAEYALKNNQHYVQDKPL